VHHRPLLLRRWSGGATGVPADADIPVTATKWYSTNNEKGTIGYR
jgi:hypothetical protein